MSLNLNGDLKFDHNRSNKSDVTNSREIGNRLLALRLIELTIKLASKLALLAAIIWTVNTVVQHIDKTNESGSINAATLSTDCAPSGGRIRIERRVTP